MPDITKKPITDHYDGHGLAEALEITRDDPDPKAGGASHLYRVRYAGVGEVAYVQFQHGARNEPGSTPGVLDSVLLAIVLDRMLAFQGGGFPSRQNAIIVTKLEECLMWMKNRADERAGRGVLGTNQK